MLSLSLSFQCGHPIHSRCLREYTKSGQYTCPVCSKAFVDMSESYSMIDVLISIFIIVVVVIVVILIFYEFIAISKINILIILFSFNSISIPIILFNYKYNFKTYFINLLFYFY